MASVASPGPILRARHLVKEFPHGEGVRRVLDDVDLDIACGSFVAVMGPSGSGKSTLLHLLGGLDTPDGGEVELDGAVLSNLSDRERTDLRRHRIGVVYQSFNLIPVLTAAENIALPAVIAGWAKRVIRSRTDEILDLIGLDDHRDKLPSQLAGGQQQRVAIGRALFMGPGVVLADEPTGNLDLASGGEVLRLFAEAQRTQGQTVVMVTHDPRSAAHADEVLLLRDGRVIDLLDVGGNAPGPGQHDRAHPSRMQVIFQWLEAHDAAGRRTTAGEGSRQPATGSG